MLKQLVERLRNAKTQEELMAIVRDAAGDPITQSRIIDMMSHEQLQTVSTALLTSVQEQFGSDFVFFMSNFVPVTIALQRAIAKTDNSVPDEATRRRLMELFDD